MCSPRRQRNVQAYAFIGTTTIIEESDYSHSLVSNFSGFAIIRIKLTLKVRRWASLDCAAADAANSDCLSRRGINVNISLLDRQAHDVLNKNRIKPDLKTVGKEIYDLLNRKAKRNWKRQRREVVIKPDHLYSPAEVATVLSCSYDIAVRSMTRMKRTANFANPRTRKRLLRIKGSDLRDYIRGKLEE